MFSVSILSLCFRNVYLTLIVLNLPFGKRDYGITELKIRSERNNQNLA